MKPAEQRPSRPKRPTAAEIRRQSSSLHYQTFPTAPPKTRGKPLRTDTSGNNTDEGRRYSESSEVHRESPLPTRQLFVLAIISLAEQTALNSISPYLPEMAATFPEVDEQQVGMYVGLIASSFALAQFATNFFWGWCSDRLGRKPIILLGTLLTAACFVAFGFCRTLWQAILVQAIMGLVNGNQGVVSTCLGEITDRSNQSKAFTYLPVVYGIGAITGPIVGGLLVTTREPFNTKKPNPYPYLYPNLFSAFVLLVDLVVSMLFLEESLEEARHLPPLGKRIGSMFAYLWQFTASTRPSYMRRVMGKKHRHHHSNHSDVDVDGTIIEADEEGDDTASESSRTSAPILFPGASNGEELTKGDVMNRNIILIMLTYLVFQLSNISFNSLYPIFAQAPPPVGRDMTPEEIGLSLAFAGVFTIVFQIGIYGRMREQIGNKITYRVSLATFTIAFVLMPWVGYKKAGVGLGLGHSSIWLYIELGFVLIVKTVAAVGGLTSALLLITNSAPNHHVLGTLNGLAQTLSAAGRAAGPFISGSLFTASTRVQPKGEALAFGLFGGIAFVGFVGSFGIRGENLEAEGWDRIAGNGDGEGEDEANGDGGRSRPNESGDNEREGLLRR